MMTKIADSHFDALRVELDSTVKPEVPKTPSEPHDAFDHFLATPSFSGKQVAIESLLRQITQSTLPGKSNAIG